MVFVDSYSAEAATDAATSAVIEIAAAGAAAEAAGSGILRLLDLLGILGGHGILVKTDRPVPLIVSVHTTRPCNLLVWRIPISNNSYKVANAQGT